MPLAQSLADAVAGLAVVAQKIMGRFWGDQTKAEASVERAGEQALERAQVAQSADELNAADAELHRVYEESAARKRTP